MAMFDRFLQHLEEVKKIIVNITGVDKIVEVGCGKGFFLEMLQQSGLTIHGYDPIYIGNR